MPFPRRRISRVRKQTDPQTDRRTGPDLQPSDACSDLSKAAGETKSRVRKIVLCIFLLWHLYVDICKGASVKHGSIAQFKNINHLFML